VKRGRLLSPAAADGSPAEAWREHYPHGEVLDRDAPHLATPRTPIQPYAATLGLLAALQGRAKLNARTVAGAPIIAYLSS